MATRSWKAENSSAPQSRNEYDTCECESSPLMGVAQEELENIVAKAVAATISVVSDEFDSQLRPVEQGLSTIERRLDQLNDVRNYSDVNATAHVDVQVPISDTTPVQRINVPGSMSFLALASDLQHTGVKELPKVKKMFAPQSSAEHRIRSWSLWPLGGRCTSSCHDFIRPGPVLCVVAVIKVTKA